jgi:dTDP-4-amino-4,6-dideoxygalactose transaminase
LEKLDGKQIPVLDLAPEIDELWDELNAAIQSVLRRGDFIMGPNTHAFEEEIAAYLGVKYAFGVNSGTDALVIALRALDIGKGDEVITTPFTFFATAEAISQTGATPVFVDVNLQTYNLDTALLEAKINSHTKAIIPVHLFGHAVDMGPIRELAQKYALAVVEDVAQALSGKYNQAKLGTMGEINAFSFFPSKNLGAFGDAGLVATNDDKLAEVANMLRKHGAKKKYYNEILGYNSRLDELQAAILRVKLPHLDRFTDGRRQAAVVYDRLLADTPGITIPHIASYAQHVYHQYTIRILNGKRDTIKQQLQSNGINTMVYYPVPVHKLPIYQPMGYTLPNAEQLANEVLSLPIWPQIDPNTQEHIARILVAALSN